MLTILQSPNPSTKNYLIQNARGSKTNCVTPCCHPINLRDQVTQWHFIPVSRSICQSREMVQWIKAPIAKPEDLSSNPRTDTVEGDCQPLQIVLCFPFMYQRMNICVCTHKYICTYMCIYTYRHITITTTPLNKTKFNLKKKDIYSVIS